MKLAIHVTHEALYKIGGIGEVINQLCTSPSYLSFFDKTLLYGPLFEYIGSPSTRLGKDGTVFYSSKDLYDTKDFSQLFRFFLEKYNIDIVYGERKIVNELNPKKTSIVEVLLVDVTRMNKEVVNFFKYLFWENFGLSSDRYEQDWDFEQYFRIGIPYFELISLLYPSAKEFYHFAHEYMGIPSLLSLELNPSFKQQNHKRIFYAHEIAPVRRIIENLGGSDISFYNLLKFGKEKNLSLEDIFGPQEDWYRTPLVKLAKRFDKIFAVGDWVVEEYKFLCPDVSKEKIAIVYNATSSDHYSLEAKLRSQEKIKKNLKNRFGFPEIDLIITHVCRLVKSKGIWRDFILLPYLDNFFEKNNLYGIYILLSTLVATGRPPQETEKMVKEYCWPFEHRVGWPDLIGYEIEIYKYVKTFNLKSKNIKALFINQFGLSKRKCPTLFTEDINTLDLRIGSDIELGMSIYEPFGIAHIETLPWGGFSIHSTCCGVSFFLEKIFENTFKPYFSLDFISTGKNFSLESLKNLTEEKRYALEEYYIANNISKIFEKIPKTLKDKEKFLEEIAKVGHKLNWDYVIKTYLIPQVKNLS
uniref:Starch synthase catalytic domain-containing protein n=1 Tax=Thermodesulfobacterium geofontis TaxID=1295609 RepID=A0A7V4JPF9_9BACT